MKRLLIILLFIPFLGNAQGLHKVFKYSTIYAAVNGGTSLSDNQILDLIINMGGSDDPNEALLGRQLYEAFTGD